MQRKIRLFPLFVAFVALTFSALLASCGESADEATETETDSDAAVDGDASSEAEAGVTIGDPWSRQPAEGQTTAAAYGVVFNNTDDDVQIVGVSSPVSDNLELHETNIDDDGVMSMAEVPAGFTVPAGGSFTFEPGGPHIMIFDIDAATYPSDIVTFTLGLDTGDELTFDAEVRMISGGMGDMDHGDMEDMDHGDMEDGDMDDMEGDDA
jgi:copper(I)-binding protein